MKTQCKRFVVLNKCDWSFDCIQYDIIDRALLTAAENVDI